jgi:hypothetical protein
MIQSETRTCPVAHKSMNNASTEFPVSNAYNRETRESVKNLINYLEETGKICPRPWYWERFFILFKPRYEPCWLSSWWKTTNEEKKELFRKQIFHLAYRTDRYPEARRFLYEMDEMNWLYE